MTSKTRWLAALALWLLAHMPSLAGDFPDRPIRLIVPFATGGTGDLVARAIAPKLGDVLGQSVFVDNRGGAGTTIGTAAAAAAPADGHTWLLVYDSFAIAHHIYRNLRYDTFRSFDFLQLLVSAPQLVIASANFPASSITELVQIARSKVRMVSFASSGVGGSNHLYPSLFADLAGIELLHVPYRGGGAALADLAGGQVDIIFATLPTVLPQVRSGQFKALGVTSAQRLDSLPGVPAVAETVPGFVASSWFGIVVPHGVSDSIQQKIRHALRLALDDEKVKSRLTGFTIHKDISSDEFRDFVASESRRLAPVIRVRNIKVD